MELSCGPRDPSVDCEALVQVNANIGVAGWATGESFCGWPGVLCGDDGRVIALSLREMDLKANAKEKQREPSKGKSDSHMQRGKRLRKEVPRQLIKRDEVAEKEPEPFVDRSLRQCRKRPVFPHQALAKLRQARGAVSHWSEYDGHRPAILKRAVFIERAPPRGE